MSTRTSKILSASMTVSARCFWTCILSACVLAGLLAILAKSIAIAILGGKSIAILFAILQYLLPQIIVYFCRCVQLFLNLG